eukprot:m.156744 g.156744  ORF g.156744 m.156744 type:complete len:494 (+) comp16299_c7_seq1:1588-3069(+)
MMISSALDRTPADDDNGDINSDSSAQRQLAKVQWLQINDIEGDDAADDGDDDDGDDGDDNDDDDDNGEQSEEEDNTAEQQAASLHTETAQKLSVSSTDDAATPTKSKTTSVSSDAAPTSPLPVSGKLEVTVSNPKKVGEGMSSYVVYTVHTKTDMESYQPMNDIEVEHRYSDFHTLFKLLVADHPGVIVPPPPPKDALNTGVVKFKSQTEELSPFVERRAAALQRFMQKVAAHPILRGDENLKLFLTTETKLTKPKTSAISNIAQKLASYVESEEWYVEKAAEVEALEKQLRQLHTALQGLVGKRKELAGLTTLFAESFGALADSEEMETLSSAMHQLADVEAKVAKLHSKHQKKEFYDLSEVAYDYLLLIGAIKTAFQQRVSAFKAWQSAESTLLKKKEAQATYTAKNKTERLEQAARDVETAEAAVHEAKQAFDDITARIKQEYKRADLIRARDFKKAMIQYAQRMANLEEHIAKAWNDFLPSAKAIGQDA